MLYIFIGIIGGGCGIILGYFIIQWIEKRQEINKSKGGS